MTNSGLETNLGRNFTGFWYRQQQLCLCRRIWLWKVYLDINPIDKTISIRGARFKVIGILKRKAPLLVTNKI
jgi:putative ABC transport system permease protein